MQIANNLREAYNNKESGYREWLSNFSGDSFESDAEAVDAKKPITKQATQGTINKYKTQIKKSGASNNDSDEVLKILINKGTLSPMGW
jgi:thiaminase